MISKNILAITGALAATVSAIPMQNKRDLVWVTETNVVMETVQATTTVWVNAGDVVPAAATSSAAHFGHKHGHPHSQSTTVVLQSVTVYPSPAAPSPSSSEAPAPIPSSSPAESTYVAPAPSSTYVAPEPSTTYVAPTSSSVYVAPAPSSTYVAPTTSSEAPPAATSSSSSGSSSSGETYTGDITYYAIGLGSCGLTNTDSEAVVALPHAMMAAQGVANPNLNPLCGKTITISYAGSQTQAKVVDTCPGCEGGSIDLSPTLFKTVAPSGDGRVHDVEWWFSG